MSMEGAAVAAVACAKCGAALAAGERFCAACGTAVPGSAESPIEAYQRGERGKAMRRARIWLLVISLVTLVYGLGMYGLQSHDVDVQIRMAEKQMEGIDPVSRDTAMKAQTGMTWQEAIDHDRGQVTLLLYVNIALAVIYAGLWLWAKKNALAASLVALTLFVTVQVVNAVMDPKTLAQGIIVKVLFAVFLAKAIQAGYQDRRLSRARQPA
jgi:hypothetical protein